jgi:hypothetical protein
MSFGNGMSVPALGARDVIIRPARGDCPYSDGFFPNVSVYVTTNIPQSVLFTGFFFKPSDGEGILVHYYNGFNVWFWYYLFFIFGFC